MGQILCYMKSNYYMITILYNKIYNLLNLIKINIIHDFITNVITNFIKTKYFNIKFLIINNKLKKF
jgi:hypothetical protein